MDLARRLSAALGADEVEELRGGHQSRVFRVAGHRGPPAVAKVVDASMVDRAELEARLDVVAALAAIDPRVCRILPLGGRRVTDLTASDGGEHHVVLYELAVGTAPDPARADDAARMGAVLSRLHASMRRLPPTSLPVVHALRATADDAPVAGPHQLLHGDFNAGNLRQDGGDVRIFDLDDCGYGPPAFDVANALYMVLFDAVTHGSVETYETFRPSFVAGYADAGGPSVSHATLDGFVELRVRALGSWLDDLDRAPIGIRTASPTWQATLRSFVAEAGGQV